MEDLLSLDGQGLKQGAKLGALKMLGDLQQGGTQAAVEVDNDTIKRKKVIIKKSCIPG